LPATHREVTPEAQQHAWDALWRRLLAPIVETDVGERARKKDAAGGASRPAAVAETSPQQNSEKPRGHCSTAEADGAR
jgi:hypothetical protein